VFCRGAVAPLAVPADVDEVMEHLAFSSFGHRRILQASRDRAGVPCASLLCRLQAIDVTAEQWGA
jgi:hypothetical protein